MLKLRRDPLSVMDSGSEFPLILGRDVSGVVVDCGSEVTHFNPGDEVCNCMSLWKMHRLHVIKVSILLGKVIFL